MCVHAESRCRVQKCDKYAVLAQLVEHLPSKQRVASSILVYRSILTQRVIIKNKTKESEHFNMKINNGDKFVATKKVWFIDEGIIVTVTGVDENGLVSFTFGEHSNGCMDSVTFEEHFKKLEFKKLEFKTTESDTEIVEITYEYVDEIMQNSEIEIQTVCDKCAVVSCKLPNGYVIVESASCPSVEEYDEDTYADICLDKIAEKIFELETYRIQEEIYRESCCECDGCECECNCDECSYDEDEDEDDFIEPDCDGCTDYGCEYNPHNSTTTKYPVS